MISVFLPLPNSCNILWETAYSLGAQVKELESFWIQRNLFNVQGSSGSPSLIPGTAEADPAIPGTERLLKPESCHETVHKKGCPCCCAHFRFFFFLISLDPWWMWGSKTQLELARFQTEWCLQAASSLWTSPVEDHGQSFSSEVQSATSVINRRRGKLKCFRGIK